jgi:hypothetical protein
MAYDPLEDDDEAQVAMPAGRYSRPSASPLAVAAMPTAPMRPDAFAAALPASYRNLYSAMNANLADFNKQRALIEAPQREKLEAYTKALRERRTGPTASERLYALGAAFLQPTAYKGIAGTLANVSPVLAAQQKARREAEEAQKELALKYDLDLAKMTADEKMKMLEGQTDLRSKILTLAAKSPKQPPRVILDTQSVTRHPYYGTEIKPPSIQSIARLKANPTEQEMALFDEQFGYGAHELILGTAGRGIDSLSGEDE